MAQPRPVLLMVQMLGAGGTERQLTEIAKGLDRSRFEPHVGVFRPGGVRHDELNAAGLPVAHFPLRSFYSPSAVAVAIRLARYIDRHGIQIVHTFDVPSNIFGVPVARLARVPVVLSSQRAARGLTPGIFHHLLRITDTLVDGIVVNSRTIGEEIVREDKVPPSLVHLCYNGIDTSVFHPAEGPGPERPFTIGSTALFRPEKDHATLIEAFAAVRKLLPEMRLVLIGGGPLQAQLEQHAARLGIADDCRFEGPTSNVADRLRQFDVFVLPSKSEALSNSLMEAMACGCCSLATRVGGNPELIADGQTGFLFPPSDVGVLADRLRMLITDDTLRQRLAAAGRDWIRGNFSREASLRRITGIYESFV
jgi:glycosyltransferase involved in cell wall biosynthesis